MSKKIAIIGKLESKFKAPYDNLEWEIWGCNKHNDMDKIPRFDLWFDIHRVPLKYPIPDEKMFYQKDFDFYRANKMLGGNYLTNSMVYMLIEAIFRGATDVAFYGCQLNSIYEDRTNQLNNLREVIFFAKGKGINVTSIEDSLLAEYPIYE